MRDQGSWGWRGKSGGCDLNKERGAGGPSQVSISDFPRSPGHLTFFPDSNQQEPSCFFLFVFFRPLSQSNVTLCLVFPPEVPLGGSHENKDVHQSL